MIFFQWFDFSSNPRSHAAQSPEALRGVGRLRSLRSKDRSLRQLLQGGMPLFVAGGSPPFGGAAVVKPGTAVGLRKSDGGFGAAGNASKIKSTSLEAMYQRYLKGELNAKVN